jgi:hypothetical protein
VVWEKLNMTLIEMFKLMKEYEEISGEDESEEERAN